MSPTNTVSMYTKAKVPIQKHTAVHFNSWLRLTAMDNSLTQTFSHFHFSDVRRPFTSQAQFFL